MPESEVSTKVQFETDYEKYARKNLINFEKKKMMITFFVPFPRFYN